MEKVRYKLVVAYRGTEFFGWQIQKPSSTYKGFVPKSGFLRTVQGVMTEVVRSVVKHPVILVGSSRTDTGVHARGQVCHFDTMRVQIPPEDLRRAINARLPEDVVVSSIEAVHPLFDSISDATHKRYEYLVWNTNDRNVFRQDMVFHRWLPMDVEAMREGAGHLVGTHDFASFARPGHKRLTTIRTVTGIDVTREGELIKIGVTGGGFLWNQVRIMVGTLIEVGIGRFQPGEMKTMLEARDRRAAGSTAPACGLYLDWIEHATEPMALTDPGNWAAISYKEAELLEDEG